MYGSEKVNIDPSSAFCIKYQARKILFIVYHAFKKNSMEIVGFDRETDEK